MGNWSNYNKPSDKEVEYAHEVADKLTEVEPEKEVRLAKGGRKREEYGSNKMPLLTGCNKEESDLIRHLMGLKFAGYTQVKAFELSEVNPSKAVSLMRRCNDAVEEAKQELLSRCMNEYHTNLWMLRAALSEMGIRAVRTLGAVMDDPKEKGFNKVKASTAILKLINVDGGAANGKESGLPAEFLITLKDNRTGIESSSIVDIDAEDAEVLADVGTDEIECPSGVC